MHWKVSAKAREIAINLQDLRIELAKPAQVRPTVCTEADHGVLTQLKEQQRNSVSSLKTRFIQTQPNSYLAFMEGPEENMQRARPYAVHTTFCVENVN